MTKKNTELETGKIKIADNVYATIISMTALDTKGIHHMSSTFNDGVNTFFGRKNAHEGVKISFNDDGAISVTLYVSPMGIAYLILHCAYKSGLKLHSSITQK